MNFFPLLQGKKFNIDTTNVFSSCKSDHKSKLDVIQNFTYTCKECKEDIHFPHITAMHVGIIIIL